jgi:hypothetical protein
MNTFIVIALIFAALLIFGVVYGIMNVSRMIDASSAHPRHREEHAVDGSGLATQLTGKERETTRRYKDTLAHSGIPEARLRADIPPIDECEIEEEWVKELPSNGSKAGIKTEAGTEWNKGTDDQDFKTGSGPRSPA